VYVEPYAAIAEELLGIRVLLPAPLVVIEGGEFGECWAQLVARVDGRGDELPVGSGDGEGRMHAARYPRSVRPNRLPSAGYVGLVPVRTVVQRGPKGKKSVAFAVDWPGWSRGAKTPEAALEVLESYRPRYRLVAAGAGLAEEFDGAGALEVVDDGVGVGSVDFWGISFSPSSIEREPMDEAELDRKIVLLRACWSYFDGVAARVSAEMQKGPRGGGRDRDQIIRHTIRTESEEFAKRLGLRIAEEAALTPDGLREYREAYIATMRSYNTGEGKRMRTWNLPFLIRHSGYHTMDHAWEMEDKDLSNAG
jgi:hypothetical protein